MKWAEHWPRNFRAPWRRLKRLGRVLQRRDLWATREIGLPTERLGTDYGGWTFWAEPLERDSVVYSFGVGEDISFDLGLIRRFGCRVHAFDPTPRSIAWLGRQVVPPEFVFHEFGLGAVEGLIALVPPPNPAHVSYTAPPAGARADALIAVPVKRLSTIAAELGHDRIDLLKMDIEGGEYDALADLLEAKVKVGQILVEFHHRWDWRQVERTRQAISRLRAHGYCILDVSPSGEEYAFVRPAAWPLGLHEDHEHGTHA